MPLHIDYRPKDFDEFIGNRLTTDGLKAILSSGDIPHTYLFHGDSGCGKTTLARILAKHLEGGTNVYEYDIADSRGIDAARAIISSMRYKALNSNSKIYILDEFHQATKDFQNALLKALEDTPKHVYFILCTTDPDKIIKTVRNRCSMFKLQKLSEKLLVRYLKKVVQKESKEVKEEILKEIAIKADGSPRQSLILLDQIINLDPENQEKVINEIEKWKESESKVFDLCKAMLKGSKWSEIKELIKQIDEDPEKVRMSILGYANSVMLNNPSNPGYLSLIFDCFSEPFFNCGKAGLTFSCYEVVKNLKS